MPALILAPLALVVAALLALLLLNGAQLLGQFIARLVPNWHIPGLGNIRSAVANGIDAALSAVGSLLDAAVNPVLNWLLAPYHLLRHFADVITHTFQSVYNAVLASLHYAQYVYNLAVKWAETRYHDAIAYAQHVYNLATAQAAKWVNALRADVIKLYHSAIAWADHIYNLALTQAAKWVNALRADTVSLFHKAEVDALNAARAAETQAKAYASAVTAAAAKVIATDITTPVEQAWVDVRDEVKAIDQALATDLPGLRTLVDRVDVTDLAGIGAAVGALAGVDVLVMRYLRECGIPNCRNLSGLGRDLQALLALAEGAGFLAFLEAAIRDPSGTAGEVIDVTGVIITDTTDTFARVVGL